MHNSNQCGAILFTLLATKIAARLTKERFSALGRAASSYAVVERGRRHKMIEEGLPKSD